MHEGGGLSTHNFNGRTLFSKKMIFCINFFCVPKCLAIYDLFLLLFNFHGRDEFQWKGLGGMKQL